jgi:hypothetical protein
MKDKTFEEIAKDGVGTIYHKSLEDGVRFVILRGPASLCAYLGIPNDHPLANQDYDNIPLDCHGGLTYGHDYLNKKKDGYFWYGWDYSHSGDKSFYDIGRERDCDDTEWTPEMVAKDSWSAKYEFSKLVKLAERIYTKAKSET